MHKLLLAFKTAVECGYAAKRARLVLEKSR